jgi:Tfp pilus assembly protein FimT
VEAFLVIFENKKKLIVHHYTIIELVAVLAIMGILTAVTLAGINGVLARQGATGAIRTLATKISLAQSFAVSKNRYVALLMPDDDSVTVTNSFTPNYSISNYTTISDNTYYFTKSRMCYVTKATSGGTSTYTWDSWIEGYQWGVLPSKTVAFITDQGIDSTAVQVLSVPAPTSGSCTALIFKPSGALVNASQVIIRAFRAAYLPDKSTTNFYWQGKETANKGWKIIINGFTGRSSYSLGNNDDAD